MHLIESENFEKALFFCRSALSGEAIINVKPPIRKSDITRRLTTIKTVEGSRALNLLKKGIKN